MSQLKNYWQVFLLFRALFGDHWQPFRLHLLQFAFFTLCFCLGRIIYEIMTFIYRQIRFVSVVTFILIQNVSHRHLGQAKSDIIYKQINIQLRLTSEIEIRVISKIKLENLFSIEQISLMIIWSMIKEERAGKIMYGGIRARDVSKINQVDS